MPIIWKSLIQIKITTISVANSAPALIIMREDFYILLQIKV